MIKHIFWLLLCVACTNTNDKTNASKKDVQEESQDTTTVSKVIREENSLPINDTLNSTAQIIAGNSDSNTIFKNIIASKNYQTFSANFSKRWNSFDSSRIQKLSSFRNTELGKHIINEKTLFYPFSGPDILYANLFFPQAEKFVMIGLEPVGTLPSFGTNQTDSLNKYYNKINTSLNAILNFSFFRTESMSMDLKNTEVNGTIHLLLLFLNRTGNSIVSAKPITVDTAGNKIYYSSFTELKSASLKTKGVEIVFKTKENQLKELSYFSLNAADDGLISNVGFRKYLSAMSQFNTYLKGASYLLHKPNFSIIRGIILNGASTITQDDSGIALRYFEKEKDKWDYTLYGEYSRPISMFSNCYQKNLDSLYKQSGSIPIGFGIGYNFKDKNSNLMVVKRK